MPVTANEARLARALEKAQDYILHHVNAPMGTRLVLRREAKAAVAQALSALDPTLVACPFCGDADFDAVGLKHHLRAGHCAVYEQTPAPGGRS